MMRTSKQDNRRRNFGIGEIAGKLFTSLSPDSAGRLIGSPQRCPFRPGMNCSKDGKVCTLRAYEADFDDDWSEPFGDLVTACPYRFEQDKTVYRWIGHELLGTDTPILLGQIGFLRAVHKDPLAGPSGRRENVGRIDNILVHPQLEPLRWCPLEMQAVYFSGASMKKYQRDLAAYEGEWPPFSDGRRRPDFRSSGPKRLMPQLQIKVPSLRRWGKKMAVVVDKAFFDAMAPMDEVSDVSNADIIWFVVNYELKRATARLVPLQRFPTTLEGAVKGLTAGEPVDLPTFERRIRERAADETPI
jgi:hypothetical protein